MPDTTRAEITASHDSFRRAAALAGWGLLYLVPGALWWPGLLIAASTFVTARGRARDAAETYALLLDAATVVHVPDLARALGLEHAGTLTQTVGDKLTALLSDRSGGGADTVHGDVR
jgi:hypothetical protein